MSMLIKMDNNYESICRICLKEKALYPIFEKIEDEVNTCIKSKISLCMNEEIHDINGFPRLICGVCNNKLSSMCNFINTYKESYRILLEKCAKDNIPPILNIDSESDLELKSIKIKEDYDIYEETINYEYEYLEGINRYEENDDELVRSQYTSLVTGNKIIKDKKTFKTKKNPILDSLLKTCKIDVIRNGKRFRLPSKKDHKKKKQKDTIKTENPQSLKPSKPCLDAENPVLCDVCGATLKNIGYLKRHRTRHFNNPTKCPQCTKVLKNTMQLKRHIKSQHGKNKYTCQQCSFVCCHEPLLRSHIKNVHNKVEKKLTCHICGKIYASPTGFIIHQRSVHTGERPEVCSVCDARFVHKSYLNEHMRLHTGETPHKCPICGRGYQQRGNMLSHVKHNHKLSDLTSEQIKNLKPVVLKNLKK